MGGKRVLNVLTVLNENEMIPLSNGVKVCYVSRIISRVPYMYGSAQIPHIVRRECGMKSVG